MQFLFEKIWYERVSTGICFKYLIGWDLKLKKLKKKVSNKQCMAVFEVTSKIKIMPSKQDV